MSITEECARIGWGNPIAGVRQVTATTLAARRTARRCAGGDRIERFMRVEGLQLAMRAAAAMGLKAAKTAIMDKLFGYSPAADWNNEDASPTVWRFSDALARQLGLSVSTARYHLGGLAAAGLITRSSHPIFQRRDVCDNNGDIVEASGIDLSPMIMRYDEIIAIAGAYEHERRVRRSLAYCRTQIRREIEAVLEAARRDQLPGSRQQIQVHLNRSRETEARNLEQFHDLIDAPSVLRDDVEDAYIDSSPRSNLNTAAASFRGVQTTAKSSFSNKSSRDEPAADGPESTGGLYLKWSLCVRTEGGSVGSVERFAVS